MADSLGYDPNSLFENALLSRQARKPFRLCCPWRRVVSIELLRLITVPRFSGPFGEPTPAPSVNGTPARIRTENLLLLRETPLP